MQNRDPREDQASLQLAVAQDSCERGGGADVPGRSAAVERTERDTEQVLVQRRGFSHVSAERRTGTTPRRLSVLSDSGGEKQSNGRLFDVN